MHISSDFFKFCIVFAVAYTAFIMFYLVNLHVALEMNDLPLMTRFAW